MRLGVVVRSCWSAVLRRGALAALLLGGAVGSLGLVSCGGCGGLGSGDSCPGPVLGFAQVDAELFDVAAAPVAGVDIWLSCGPAAGADHQRTDARGRASIRLGYGDVDSTIYPMPPRDSTGGFRVPCLVWANLRTDPATNPSQDSVPVYFAPPDRPMVPTPVVLRATAP